MNRKNSVSISLCGVEVFSINGRERADRFDDHKQAVQVLDRESSGESAAERAERHRLIPPGEYHRLHCVAIVEPVGDFEVTVPDEDDPNEYKITENIYRGLTSQEASDKAGDFNDAILAKEGNKPSKWAVCFAPGAIDESLKYQSGHGHAMHY